MSKKKSKSELKDDIQYVLELKEDARKEQEQEKEKIRRAQASEPEQLGETLKKEWAGVKGGPKNDPLIESGVYRQNLKYARVAGVPKSDAPSPISESPERSSFGPLESTHTGTPTSGRAMSGKVSTPTASGAKPVLGHDLSPLTPIKSGGAGTALLSPELSPILPTSGRDSPQLSPILPQGSPQLSPILPQGSPGLSPISGSPGLSPMSGSPGLSPMSESPGLSPISGGQGSSRGRGLESLSLEKSGSKGSPRSGERSGRKASTPAKSKSRTDPDISPITPEQGCDLSSIPGLSPIQGSDSSSPPSRGAQRALFTSSPVSPAKSKTRLQKKR